jgi:hypothetical protein
MTSRIVPTNIDGTFPVAGQDNSSQGFRDNFTNIKNNFTFARNEITDLQDNVLLKSALSGSTLDNDMAGAQLTRPQLKAWTEGLNNIGSTQGTVTISYLLGNAYKISTSDSITLSLVDWPTSTGSYGSVVVWINVTNTSHTLTLPSSIDAVSLNDIIGWDGVNTISFTQTGYYGFEFGSVDAGTSFFIRDLTRNRNFRGNASVGGNLTVANNVTVSGNLYVGTYITTARGTNANITIDPDGVGDVVLPINTELYVGGNVIHGGGFVVGGYQYSAPSGNFATQISPGKSRMIFDPTTTIATGNVIMPNVAVDGTIISVHSTAQITTFGANSLQSGTVVKPSNTFTLSAGTGVEYFYHAVENTWYKIR